MKDLEICHFFLKEGPKRLKDALYGCEKVEKAVWFTEVEIGCKVLH